MCGPYPNLARASQIIGLVSMGCRAGSEVWVRFGPVNGRPGRATDSTLGHSPRGHRARQRAACGVVFTIGIGCVRRDQGEGDVRKAGMDRAP